MEMYQALLIALVACFGKITGDLGYFMFDRPIVLVPLTGLCLGNLEAGLILGAELELVFLGVVSIGGATPADVNMGSVLASAFAISMNQGTDVALALAFPIGVLLQMVKMLIYFFRATTMHRVDEYAKTAEFDKITFMHFGHCAIYVTTYGFIAFFSLVFGAEAINTIVQNIPTVIMDGLKVTSDMLPAVGFALLLNMLWDKKLAVFLLFGFVLSSYLQLPVLAVSIIALTIGVVMIVQDRSNKGLAPVQAMDHSIKEEEDFFNE